MVTSSIGFISRSWLVLSAGAYPTLTATESVNKFIVVSPLSGLKLMGKAGVFHLPESKLVSVMVCSRMVLLFSDEVSILLLSTISKCATESGKVNQFTPDGVRVADQYRDIRVPVIEIANA